LQWFDIESKYPNYSLPILSLQLTVVQVNETVAKIIISSPTTVPLLVNRIAYCWISFNEQMLMNNNIGIMLRMISQNSNYLKTDLDNAKDASTMMGLSFASFQFNFQGIFLRL